MGTLSTFRRLAADPTANVIVISAVALIPLLGMVGGAVDASRYYMTTSRLQAACDAGALAARRGMGDDNFTTADREVGENFFDQNYDDGLFGLESLSRTYTGTTEGEVNGVASGNLPTSLMHIFGYENFNVSVECSADINISNTDIMFVVDVTGSMNCAPDNPSGGSCGNTEDPGSKISGLRSAVMTFYDTVDSSTASTAQVRYGMVPYASNVNVGQALLAKNSDWLATSHTYQSREANETTTTEWVQLAINVLDISDRRNENDEGKSRKWKKKISESQCNALKPDDFEDELQESLSTGSQQGQTLNGAIRTTEYRDTNEPLRRGEGFVNYNKKKKRCEYGWYLFEYRADIDFEIVEELVTETTFDNWTYKPVTYDLTTLYDDNEITLPIGYEGADFDVDWDGCVEEANTTTTASFDPTPSEALDLDINLVPSSDSERWKPLLFGAVWKRENSNGNVFSNLTQTSDEKRPSYSCPKAAFRLTDISRSDLQSYVNSLQGRSNTYHDIGMIWGGRFVSPNGVFASENATAPNGDAISRHIVFMTDGLLAPNIEVYGTYGVEWWDRRVTPNGDGGEARTRHAERFQAACRAARQENISVWVVAFGTSLSQNLKDCATPGRAFVADTTEQLREKFQEIAQKIAALRLTQ